MVFSQKEILTIYQLFNNENNEDLAVILSFLFFNTSPSDFAYSLLEIHRFSNKNDLQDLFFLLIFRFFSNKNFEVSEILHLNQLLKTNPEFDSVIKKTFYNSSFFDVLGKKICDAKKFENSDIFSIFEDLDAEVCIKMVENMF